MYVLDADVLIDVQRGFPPATAWFGSLKELPVVPGFVVMELIQQAQNSLQVQTALYLVSGLARVWPTEADCTRALDDFAKLHLSHRIGLVDSLIAATAVGLGAELCTFNRKHFRAVPGLKTVQPYPR